ncbi:MAG TPA: HAMP domain-containing sensor histidine kinase [Candidatus Limnocylindrales bacterium]
MTLLYTVLFALCGAIVVGISYFLVAQSAVPLAASLPEPGPAAVDSFAAQCQAQQLGSQPDKQLIAKCIASFQQQGAQAQFDLTLSHLLLYSLITLAAVIAVAAVLGWILAGRTLRPVHQITAAARAASEHNLSARVALTGPRDELRDLADTFDDMLDRLQAAFEAQQRFIANASHELRTPLTVMRTTVDVVLDNPDSSPDDLRGMAADLRAAVDRAEHLISALLILARNERGLTVREHVDLATVAEDVLDAADLHGLRVQASLESAVIAGDPVLAERLVANLVDNAARYNEEGGEIWIRTRAEAGSSQLVVANTGPVVSPADAERVFEPFQRLSERASHDGVGLGLAIVASIAAIHGGSAAATPRDDGGLTVTVTIPAAPALEEGSGGRAEPSAAPLPG